MGMVACEGWQEVMWASQEKWLWHGGKAWPNLLGPGQGSKPSGECELPFAHMLLLVDHPWSASASERPCTTLSGPDSLMRSPLLT